MVEKISCMDISDEDCDKYPTCKGCPGDASADPDPGFELLAGVPVPVDLGPMNDEAEKAEGGGEVRVKDPRTGGEKGQKLARFDLIPAGPELELAEHYGKGCAKYSDRNWERGFAWSLAFAAARRHLNAFWRGEDLDPQTRTKHVIAAAWHCLALAEFMDVFRQGDDRPKRALACLN